jgi:hypothetical protein
MAIARGEKPDGISSDKDSLLSVRVLLELPPGKHHLCMDAASQQAT